MESDTYQIKKVQDLLPLFELLPLDDKLHLHGWICIVTGKSVSDLHQLQKASAIGEKRWDAVEVHHVLRLAEVRYIRPVLNLLFGLCLLTQQQNVNFV